MPHFSFAFIVFARRRTYILFMYFALTFIFSYGLGMIFKDQYLLGSTTLYLGFVQMYFTAKGKWFEEFVGIFQNLLSTITCVMASMYASAVFTAIVYIPLSVFSLVTWKNNEKDSEVRLNKMSAKMSLLTIVLVLVSTLVFSLLLSIIPTQRFAILDTAGDILNICGIILIAMRYKEGWLVWLMGSFVDLATWTLVLSGGHSNNGVMMILMSVVYIFLDCWGYASFIKLRKKQEKLQKI